MSLINVCISVEFSDPPENLAFVAEKRIDSHCLILTGTISHVRFLALYKHPKFSRSNFLHILAKQLEEHSTEQLVVFGDMNIDLSDSSNASVLEFFEKFNLKSCIPPSKSTTDYNTHLDVCFTNMSNLQSKINENYYSYHK